MKSVTLLVAAAVLALSPAVAAEHKLGKPLTAKEPISLQTLYSDAGPLVGKTVQVIGKVVEVCEMAGCWMSLTDDKGNLLRIKVDDGVIVFPKDAVGKTAIAEGMLEKHQLTREQVIEQAREEAREAGRKFNPASVKSGRTVYQIAGTGASILD